MKDTFDRIGLNIALTQTLSSGFIFSFLRLNISERQCRGKKQKRGRKLNNEAVKKRNWERKGFYKVKKKGGIEKRDIEKKDEEERYWEKKNK